MTVTNELMCDAMKALRDDIRRVEGKVVDIGSRVRALDLHVAGLVQSRLGEEGRFASLSARVERIERRLDLVD